MATIGRTLRQNLRLLGPGSVLILAVVFRKDLAAAFWQGWDVGVYFLFLFPLFLIWNHTATVGWRALIDALNRQETPSIWRLSLIRLEAQSVNLVLPFSIGAPVVKVSLLGRYGCDTKSSVAAVTMDTIASAAAGFLFSSLAMALHWSLIPGGTSPLWIISSAALLLIVLLFSSTVIATSIYRQPWLDRRSGLGRTLEYFVDSPSTIKSATAISILTHMLERIVMASEIWIIAYGLGLSLSLSQLSFTAAMVTGFTLLFFFLPGQAGAAEGGMAFAFSILGLPPILGLSVGLVRRARQIVVYGFGIVLLFFVEGCRINRKSKQIDAKRNSGINPLYKVGGDTNAGSIRSTL